MTAERWWVRAAARWIARIDSVKGQLTLVFQAMTGISLASGMLKYFGATWAVGPFIAAVGAGVLVYAYLYAEGGVWNQVSRDRVDMSNNFAGPTMRIDDEMTARTIIAGLQGGPLDEDQVEAIKEEADITFDEYRDGYEVER